MTGCSVTFPPKTNWHNLMIQRLRCQWAGIWLFEFDSCPERNVSAVERRTSYSCIPLVAQVFPVAAFAPADLVEGRDELDAHDVFRHLVAKLAFDARTYRSAVGNWQHFVVQLISENCLRVIS